jgi:glycosyltransferase involved in cell wall biosynthesis
MKKKIIFLYAEVTPYLLGCLNQYCKTNKSTFIKVIYVNMFHNLKIDKNGYELISKEKFKSKKELYSHCKEIKPDMLIVSGRMSKDYLYVAKKLKDKTIRVTVQDTLYEKSIKQKIIKIFNNQLYKKYFDKFWGVGSLQTKFAIDIGYKENDIEEGFYVADKIFFKNSCVLEYKNRPLKILFIGRLVKEKNILELAKAIESINQSNKSMHELVIIGDGYLKNKILNYNCVSFKGSQSQEDIVRIALGCDVFCLPSIYEPWGVVTHEMCALGLPILISDKCGSSEDLVLENFNGFKFNPFDKDSIKKSIIDFDNLEIQKKRDFSKNSITMSKKINHNLWASSLNSLLVK